MSFTVQRLSEWMTFSEIQPFLGYKSTQGVYHLVFTSRAFPTDDVRYVQVGTQPLYLVRARAVEDYKQLRDRQLAQRGDAEAELVLGAKAVAARKRMRALMGQQGITGRAERLAYVGDVLGREVTDWYRLTLPDASKVIEKLTADQP